MEHVERSSASVNLNARLHDFPDEGVALLQPAGRKGVRFDGDKLRLDMKDAKAVFVNNRKSNEIVRYECNVYI